MTEADISTPKRTRLRVALLILLIHVAAILGLIRVFAPGAVDAVVENLASAMFVTVKTMSPGPVPGATAGRERRDEGAPGSKAIPREVAAPEPKVVITELTAPRASSTGVENRSGTAEAGAGAGAADSGAGGEGLGRGLAGRAEKIAGDIDSARDYPREGRDARIGGSVTIAITVGTDGLASACRVVRAGPDPVADRVTCDLAMKRFRFRPATDEAGNPVVSVYGWRQRWFLKASD